MDKMILMGQVHGNNVVIVGKNNAGKIIQSCDALISNDPGVILCVRVADCLPIGIVDKKQGVIALIHAGWRGLEKNIISGTVKKMMEGFSCKPSDFLVTIGPHICQKHFEVKGDVLSKFISFPEAILYKDGKTFLDLGRIAELQLVFLGLKKANILIDKRCTFEDLSLHSFRRDKTQKRLMIYLSKGLPQMVINSE